MSAISAASGEGAGPAEAHPLQRGQGGYGERLGYDEGDTQQGQGEGTSEQHD